MLKTFIEPPPTENTYHNWGGKKSETNVGFFKTGDIKFNP